MIYTEDDIKQDLLKTNVKEFYMKYLLRADNWYFERILNIDEKDIIHAVDDFKMLVSDAFDIGFNNTVMVGSAKLGVSLSPEKFLKHFTDEGDNQSDIDIAAIVKGSRLDLQNKLKAVWDISADIGLENDVVVSPTVIPYDEFEEYKEKLPYYRNIAREGMQIG